MEQKTILFYYELFFAGGTEHSILKMIKQLYKKYKVIVAYDNPNTQEMVLKEIRKYAEVINLNNIQHVNIDICICCSQRKQIQFNEFSNKVIAKKYFGWKHMLFFETYKDAEYEKSYRDNLSKFICVSEAVKSDLIKKYPELESKCIVIYNYIDVEEVIEKSAENCDLQVDESKLNFISVSRLAFDKGFHRMKMMCDSLDERNVDYKWYVIGKAYTDEIDREIKNMFKGNDKVEFLGYKDNPFPYIKKMNYYVLLSEREAWGLAISESLILKVPCIVTDFEAATYQINNSNGIIVPRETDSYSGFIDNIINNKYTIKDVNYDNSIMDWIKLIEGETK